MISIVTINKNNLSGLIKTVESVQNQTFSDFNWYIIDGISTDGSVDYINKIQFANLKKIVETDQGIYDAMNKGVDLVEGNDLVLFLNSGDRLYNNDTLATIVNKSKNYDFVYGDFIKEQLINNKSCQTYVRQPEKLNLLWLFNKTLNHQSYLIRGVLLKKYKFNLKYKICADWVQLMDIIRLESNLKWLKLECLISVYDGDGLSNRSNYMLEHKEYLDLNFSEIHLKSVEDIASVITKRNFTVLQEISRSKWRWKLLTLFIGFINLFYIERIQKKK
jgi:glycosyltransferase involved in cell wall biosynthesis